MSEYPILFTGEMVRAILGGRKTQTRRIISPQPVVFDRAGQPDYANLTDPKKKWQVGDTLWVREGIYCDEKGCFGRYKAGDAPVGGELPLIWAWKTKNLTGRYMPRTAARIFLEITNIRVERVRDISEKDVKAEGVIIRNIGETYWRAFHNLWDSINAKRGYGWDKNPWVWIVEFKFNS